MKTIILIATIALSTIVSCKIKQATTGDTKIGAPCVVYKTKADYSSYVPVTLSADKTTIVAYPAIKDIYYKGKLALPSALQNGYLLDNRGVGANSAFLKLTYADYAKLKDIPKLTDLYNMVLEKDPFVEIYNLGDRTRFKDEVADINKIIAKGGLKKFARVK